MIARVRAVLAAGGEVWVGDETTLWEFPPLRAAWSRRGRQAEVVISRRNAGRVIVVLITDRRAKLFQLFELRPAFGGVVVRDREVFHIGPARNTEQQRLYDLLAEDLENQPIVEAARPCRQSVIRAVAACLAAGALCEVTRPECIVAALVCVDRIADAIEECDDGGP